MAEAAETNWLDVLRAALWPTLALIALILLQGPAIKILTKVSEGGAQEIEAGPVKITFSPEGLRRVPPPSPAVGDVLPKLTQGEVDALMAHAPEDGLPICQADALKIDSSGSRQKAAVYDKLFGDGLVSLESPRPDDANQSWCELKGLRTARLTETGKSVREYLLSVITNSITISPS
jgi:hypothetical protein